MTTAQLLLLAKFFIHSTLAFCSSSHLDNNSWQAMNFLKKTEFYTQREKALLFNACHVTYSRRLLYNHDNNTPCQSSYFSPLNAQIADKIQLNCMADLSIKLINNHVGYGVFAKHHISQGEYIGEFAGELKRSEDRLTNVYYVDYSKGYVVDASLYGNETRFINDGQKDSNCQAWMILGHDGMAHIAMIAQRDIQAKEQLTMNYSNDYWDSYNSHSYEDMRHYTYSTKK